MKRQRRLTLAVAAALAAGGIATGAEPPAVERAVQVLRDALVNGDDNHRVFTLERTADLHAPGLLDAARSAAGSPDRVSRTYALEMLASIDARGNREYFVDALASPYRSVRLRGLKALLSLNDETLAPRLIQVLQADPDPDLRALAARGLGAVGGQGVRQALKQALDDPHPVVPEAAVDGLVARGSLEVGFDLLDRARKAPSGEAARLLRLAGRVPNRDLVGELDDLLQAPNREVRVAAAAALLAVAERTR